MRGAIYYNTGCAVANKSANGKWAEVGPKEFIRPKRSREQWEAPLARVDE